jgi:hypothetical protein
VFCPIVTTMLLAGALGPPLCAQAANPSASQPGEAISMYRQILNPAFSPEDVHRVRNVSIDREDLHIVLTDGVIGLIKPVNGHVTGAFFEGEGHILLRPPDRAERTSLALFTKAGVLDDTFGVAYFRFFDDKLVDELRAGFRPAEETQQFLDRWSRPLAALARGDSLQLLQGLTGSSDSRSQYIRARLVGTSYGTFDVVLNSQLPEQIVVAQATTTGSAAYYDTWTSFSQRSAREAATKAIAAEFEVSDYKIRTRLSPPNDLFAEAALTLVPFVSGQRTVIFELSRHLKVSEVRVNGQPAEFIQNEAIDGSELARRGNDLTAVVLPAPSQMNVPLKLAFRYSGPVMFDAGGELLYVGDRGTWYPSPSPAFANYDLTFEYPTAWTLVATGKQVSKTAENGRWVSRFVSEKPITHAGFNLGKFETAESSADGVAIHAYAARNIEEGLSRQESKAGFRVDPARQVQRIADQAASSVKFLSRELDPFPYSHLEVSQLPALLSQSWPSLIYLSSMAYLDPRERRALGLQDPFLEMLLGKLMLAHETAHQWWGDAVNAESYRDEWMIEALANYSAILMMEQDDPSQAQLALDHYKKILLRQTPSGILGSAGSVTLGRRLVSSKFPDSYDPVVYGRGTWLIHMLRTMLREAGDGKSDALFFAALKGLLAGSTNHKISTRDLQRAFEQVLPRALNYEGQKSLDWFFDSWVNGADIPQFSLEKVRLTPSAGGGVKVSGAIHQEFAGKDMITAVPLYAVGENGQSKFLAFVFADETNTEFNLSAPAGTKEILLDPNQTLLRR